MAAKVSVLEDLGETAILLPQLVNRALAANDRVKYFLTLLQAAREHADHPEAEASSLRSEREACGVDDASLDAIVSSTSRDGADLRVLRVARLHAAVVDAIREMMEPLTVVASGDTNAGQVLERLRERLDRLVASAPVLEDDHIPVAYVEAMTRGPQGQGDSLHVLVMELHRELNRLQRAIATESLDGADVYAIDEADRRLVAAFMAGVNATADLKFDHPGLSTSATRTGDRLVIQNDIGTTASHVFVLHVTGLTITVTYTDVHSARLQFFQDLLEPVGLSWSAGPAQRSTAAYQLTVGQVACHDDQELRSQLTLVGSRLVFLIDWNRARKRLSRFVKKSDAIAVLKWAADQQVGHRAFLQLGDVRLIYTAMERAARAQIRFGARLDEILGRESARAFLQAVLRLSSEGLRDHKSTRLIQDEIHAELLRDFLTSEQSAIALAAEHAMLVAALAGLVRDALARCDTETDPAVVLGFAARAKAWESRADQLVSRSRTVLEHAEGGRAITRLLAEADDVVDGLEEAAFLLTLLTRGKTSPKGLAALRSLADLIAPGAQGYVKCLECARDAHHFGTREDIQEFLVAVDALIAFEHESDDRERTVSATLLDVAGDFRELHVLSAIAERLGDAADALTRCALILRDYVLETLNAR